MTLIDDWLDQVAARGTGSESTRKNYIVSFNHFLKATKTTPEEFLALAKKDVSKAESLLAHFFVGLVEGRYGRKYARSSAVSHYAAVQSFLRAHGVILTKKVPRSWVEKERPPMTKEIIKRAIEYADPCMKAVIAVMKDSGLAPVDVSGLKYGHVKDDLEAGKIPVKMRILREKTKISFTSFIGSDAIDYLKIYLGLRRAGTEKIPPETVTPESPLFRANASEVKPLSLVSFKKRILRIRKQAGLGDFEAYDIRRFFRSALTGANVNDTFIEFLMGHKLPQERRSYVLSHLPEYEALYVNSYHAISLKERTSAKELQKQQLLNTARFLGIPPEKIEQLRQILETHDLSEFTEEDWAAVRGLLAPTTARNGSNGSYESKYVTEEELLGYLDEGWEVVTQVNGRIAVRRPTLLNGVR